MAPVRSVTAMVVGSVLAAALATGAAAAPSPLLPDLVQERPGQISLTRIGGRERLGFRSAVHNAGAGPLTILGARPSTATRDMRAYQLIRQSDGTARREPVSVGLLRYVRSRDHSHWHYRPFERYMLRNARGARVGRDTKSGFCLGDRYRVAGVPGAVATPVRVGACGPGRTSLRRLIQGISVGWGDDYAGYLEGQSIDVTGLPSGRYRLIHVVNGDRRLRERSFANNSAAVWIELYRAGGRMRVRVLAGSSAAAASSTTTTVSGFNMLAGTSGVGAASASASARALPAPVATTSRR